jgi:GAF domain-containing protein
MRSETEFEARLAALQGADATPGLAELAPALAALVAELGVRSVLVMRSDPAAMVVAATAGEARDDYTVGAAGSKALGEPGRVPLYCERVVESDSELFVRDSRDDAVFAGNDDEVEYGLSNYLGLPVHDSAGAVVGTVCVLDDRAREYSESERASLGDLRDQVEGIIAADAAALSEEDPD